MQSARVFRKRYVVFLLLALAIFGLYKAMHFSPIEQDIYKKVKVNNLVTLYVTEASAGATTGFSYRYYLVKAATDDAAFLSQVGDKTPFLITDDENASATVKDDQLFLRVRGNVYSFQNGSDQVRIHLDASPY